MDSIIKKITDAGGIVGHSSLGSHTDKNLASMYIEFGDWHFNAWFNTKTDYFHAPSYYKKYMGILTMITIEEGINEMIKMGETNVMSKLMRQHWGDDLQYELITVINQEKLDWEKKYNRKW